MRLVLKIFLGLGFLCLMIILMNNASADIHTTQASGNAGTAGTWDNGVPDAGDDLVFTGAYNIAMNQALTYGTITLAAGYSGTATQGAVDFGYTDFTMSAGTWTGLATQTQTCSGNFNRIGGTTTPWATRLIMTGTDKILSINSGQGLHSLTVSGTVIINQAEGMYAASNMALWWSQEN